MNYIFFRKGHKISLMRFFLFFIIIINLNFEAIYISNNYVNIQNKQESNYANDYRTKIDSDLLKLMDSKKKEQDLSIIILYNYDDDTLKKELEQNSEKGIYNYKLIPASSVRISSNKIYSIAKSTSVRRVCLDKKVYPLSSEKTNKFKKSHELPSYASPYVPLVNQSLSQIGAPYLWDLNFNGSGVVVAVLDTGIDNNHPDLNDLDDNVVTSDPKIINETSFIDFNFDGVIDEGISDNVGHGTHVAGIISGTGEASNYQLKGVAPASELMNVKVLSTYGGYESWIIKGIEYATFGPDMIPNNGDEADIISMSIGGSGFIDDVLIEAVDNAWELNKTVVIATGNSGDDFFTLESPSMSSKCISVGAVDSTDSIASFSSRGPSPDLRMGVDICAPGVNIIAPRANISDSSMEEGYYTVKSGTSMATPFVAGGIALLLHSNPLLTPTAIKTALMTSAVDVGVSNYIQGSGRLDINGAYNILNKISGFGETELKRSDSIEYISLENANLEGFFESPFYSQDFGDIHSNGTYSMQVSDIWDMFFTVSYTFENSPRVFESLELGRNYPRNLRWLIQNSTHKIASESIKTPDNILQIEILYELYNNSDWVRLSFNISSLVEKEVSNVKFYYFMDADVYGGFQMDSEQDYDDDAQFLQSINALVANDTYYDEDMHPKYGFHPNNFLGFSSPNQSTAFEVNYWRDVYENMISGTLNNNTAYRGDVALAQEWLNISIFPSDYAFIPLILAFGDNQSHFIDNINIAKNFPLFNLHKSDISINSLIISNPIYNGTQTNLNISVSNIGYGISSKFNVSLYIDGTMINKSEVMELDINNEEIISVPIIFNTTGIYNVTIISDLSLNEFANADENNRFQKDIKVLFPILASFFPSSPLDNPMQLKYSGQFLFWNCSIFQGEKISDLKLNKTGTGKEFFTFNSKPSNIHEISIANEIGQNFVNISVNIPKGSIGDYLMYLQLLNGTTILFEIPLSFKLTMDLPLNLLINDTLVEEGILTDDDGILEGDEYGEVEFHVHSNNTVNDAYNVFLVISSKNNSLINILDYNINVDRFLGANESEWSSDDFDFLIPYNISDTVFTINSILFASLDAQNFIPFFMQEMNFSVRSRISGTPDLTLHSVVFNEFIIGNNNDVLEAGELGYIEIDFRNIGDGSALQIYNTNITCSHSGVIIPKPYFIFLFAFPSIHIQWNSIEPNEITSDYSSFPFIILSDSIRAGEVLSFQIDIEYLNMAGDVFQETFYFSYQLPQDTGDGGNGNRKKSTDGIDILLMALIFGSCISGGTVGLLFFIRKRKKKLAYKN